jgi:ssDNA-binding Zn-finger/Zn-ribbon topoisomerase 1
VSGTIWAYLSDKRNYNKGVCPKCGKPLKCIDMDSQGGRWYACADRYDKESPCDYDCWISYDVDK